MTGDPGVFFLVVVLSKMRLYPRYLCIYIMYMYVYNSIYIYVYIYIYVHVFQMISMHYKDFLI